MPELSGFNLVDPAVITKRMVVRVSGRDGVGKTRFALTAPGPIAYFDMDRGAEGVVEQFAGEKDIHVASYYDRPIITESDMEARWEVFNLDWATAIADPGIRTIVWDTDNAAWEWMRMAMYFKADQIPPNKYGPLNRGFKAIIDMIYDTDKNMVFITHDKKCYVDRVSARGTISSWNGEWETGGFNTLPNIVQCNLRLAWTAERAYHGTIGKCRQNGMLRGQEIEGEEIDFVSLALMVYPNSRETDWV